MFKRLLALLSLAICGYANAGVGYYLNVEPDVYYPTALQACERFLPEYKASRPMPNYPNAVYLVGTAANPCTYAIRSSPTGTTLVSGAVFQVGGQNVGALSYECKSGEPDSLTWPRHQEDDKGAEIPGTKVPIFTNPVCLNGCEANHTSSVDDCFYDNTNFLYCVFTVQRTGTTCASPTKAPDVPGGCPAGYQEVGGKCQLIEPPDPCETDPNGEGCGGGDPGGGDPCEANPNAEGCPGGGDPGGGDPCEANPNAEGCPGGGDPGGGDPGGGDPGGGDDGGSAGGYANCDAPLACSGDAIACAQLELQKYEYCNGLEKSDFPGQQDDIADFLDQPDFEAEEDEEINLGEMFSEGTRFLPSSCPQAKSFSLTTNGGRTFSLSFEPLCQFASDLSYLIVAAAAVFYALYVGRAVGGE
jgi:hypothetical protein